MDDVDSLPLFRGAYSPTVLQAAGGCYAAFCYVCNNPMDGTRVVFWGLILGTG